MAPLLGFSLLLEALDEVVLISLSLHVSGKGFKYVF
jgi:hypothetical protein